MSIEIAKLTYQKINTTSFNHPFIFDKLAGDKLRADDLDLLNLAQNEDDLKLFIKIPINNKSSIVVLEGEYLNYNDKIYNTKLDIIEQHKLVTNFFEGQYADVESETNIQFDTKYIYEPLENRKFKPISQLQLLMMNTGVSYPFADRLIEYLSENAITSLDRLPDNIKRAQKVLSSAEYSVNTKRYSPTLYGLWDNKLAIYLYDAIVNNERLSKYPEVKHDLLGYIDKDTERLVTRKNKNTNKLESISKIDIYPNLYSNMYLTDREKFKDEEEIK
jgi:hypothetical protein